MKSPKCASLATHIAVNGILYESKNHPGIDFVIDLVHDSLLLLLDPR